MAGRWFIVKHEECGSVFTINSDQFEKGMDIATKGGRFLSCPSCRLPTILASDIQAFLREYSKLTEKFAELKPPRMRS